MVNRSSVATPPTVTLRVPLRAKIQRIIFRIGLWSGGIGPGYALRYQPAGARLQSGGDKVLCPFAANARVTHDGLR